LGQGRRRRCPCDWPVHSRGGSPPLAPVLSTVIGPLELDLFIREQLPVALHTFDVRKCANPTPRRSGALMAPQPSSPESDAADSHGRESTGLVPIRIAGVDGRRTTSAGALHSLIASATETEAQDLHAERSARHFPPCANRLPPVTGGRIASKPTPPPGKRRSSWARAASFSLSAPHISRRRMP
jgi:hypothetical protein